MPKFYNSTLTLNFSYRQKLLKTAGRSKADTIYRDIAGWPLSKHHYGFRVSLRLTPTP